MHNSGKLALEASRGHYDRGRGFKEPLLLIGGDKYKDDKESSGNRNKIS